MLCHCAFASLSRETTRAVSMCCHVSLAQVPVWAISRRVKAKFRVIDDEDCSKLLSLIFLVCRPRDRRSPRSRRCRGRSAPGTPSIRWPRRLTFRRSKDSSCLFVVVVEHIATPGEHERGRCHHHRCTPVYSAQQKRCEDSEPRPGCGSPAALPPNLQNAFGCLPPIGEKALQPGQRAVASQFELRLSRSWS